ncbi:related to Phosducin [Melanopsichium pennsylvanicum]|uniref:Related to Phosducin n=1 Tax=Melanopsichium pennsylvanicum TaxID=63383 RepID=A0AAJ5C5N4_9BASI|nr:related to Phosducin [Melanopsichium pennsylvanicum]
MSASGDRIEAAILQGIDAHPTSSYPEDRRAAATHNSDHSATNTDDELGSDLPDDHNDGEDRDDYDHDDDDAHDSHPRSSAAAGGASNTSGGIKGLLKSKTATRGQEGASNTGPKGVLRDRQLRAQQETNARLSSIAATNRKMESMALSSETYSEQVQREKHEAAARLNRDNADSDQDDDQDEFAVSRSAIADLQAKERRREMRIAELKSFHAARNSANYSGTAPLPTAGAKIGGGTDGAADRYFGHLREVDERGYVSAIDNEHAQVPIVIHIYSKAVAQCNVLTASLASLARQYPRTKFLQVQAAAIGFGKSINDDDDDEEYDEFNPKTLEVLPTVLVYKAAKLMANLVRVDLDPMWNQGREQDVRDLLDNYGALTDTAAHSAVTGSYPREEDDNDDD